MKRKNENWRLKLLGFSPWILGCACILLLLVIAFFAVSNYEREKRLITNGLEQKALTLVRFINSAVADSVRTTVMQSASYEKWETHMLPALKLAVEQPGVDSILLVDKDGNILLSAGAEPVAGEPLGGDMQLLIEGLGDSKKPLLRTKIIRKSHNGQSKAIIATRYIPRGPYLKGNKGGRRHMGGGRLRHSHHFALAQNDMRRVELLSPVYLVQLDFSPFMEPLRRQFLQIVLELIAIFLVGLGGTLSFFTLRGLKGSEKTLEKMRVFNVVLVSSLPLGLVATDENGGIQVFNDAAESMTGLRAVDVEGKQPVDCLPGGLAKMLGQKKISAERGQDEAVLRCELDLGGFALEVTVVHVAATENILGAEVMLLRDLTHEKRLEVELQRSERLAAIGKMAAGVAHELRNPLSSIKGLTLLLKSKVGPKTDGEDTADTLVREVERLNRSIGELLDYAKPGGLVLKPSSLEKIIAKTLLLIDPDLASYGVIVEKEIETDLPAVLIDRDKINQVLLNVLLNSLQAMEEIEGGRRLKISLEKQGDYLLLSVADNGCGIDPMNLKIIFDPYFTTKGSGTGLGLALSLKIVEEHGGKLLVSSVAGEWTEFQLYLRCV